MRGTRFALCILFGLLFSSALPAVAEASPAGGVFIWAQGPQRTAIPKTRRVKNRRRPSGVAAPQPHAIQVKHPQLPSMKTAAPAVRAAIEHASQSGSIDELEIEWFVFDVVLDDPQRTTAPKLRLWRPLVGLIAQETPPATRPREGVRPRASALRARLLPKIPASDDVSSFV